MTRQELINYCLTLPASYEDYPFDEAADDEFPACFFSKDAEKTYDRSYRVLKEDRK